MLGLAATIKTFNMPIRTGNYVRQFNEIAVTAATAIAANSAAAASPDAVAVSEGAVGAASSET